jgi:pheromone shutdown-related protein TraB
MLECPPDQNITRLEIADKQIYLLGTAHVSAESVAAVERAVASLELDCIAVELDAGRAQSLKDPERWKNTNIVEVIRQGKAYMLLAQLALASFQKRIGAALGVKPGAEMLRAMQLADERGLAISYVDRNVRTTLRRLWGYAGFWTGAKIIACLCEAVFTRETIAEGEIEKLKERDALDAVLAEFSEKLPRVRKTLIDERDIYLAQKIREAPGRRVLAVVGAGHVPGIIRAIPQQHDLHELEQEPSGPSTSKILNWAIPILVLGLLVGAYFSAGFETSADMFLIWFLVHGVLAALGAIAALAHPLTVLASFLAAPFTALHPLVGAGWVAALTEALLRKPKVSDFESVADDVRNISGLWKNGVSRIFLVMILTSLGSAVGTLIGIPQMLALLP